MWLDFVYLTDMALGDSMAAEEPSVPLSNHHPPPPPLLRPSPSAIPRPGNGWGRLGQLILFSLLPLTCCRCRATASDPHADVTPSSRWVGRLVSWTRMGVVACDLRICPLLSRHTRLVDLVPLVQLIGRVPGTLSSSCLVGELK